MGRDYRKIEAYQLADELVILVYKYTKDFPKAELFGLVSQMRRAAVSMLYFGHAVMGHAVMGHVCNLTK
ncbi:MAG: four helix bundle protein [bacterium]